MVARLLFILFSISYSLTVNAQIDSAQYRTLLDSVFRFGEIVCAKSLKFSVFEREDISDLLYTARGYDVDIDSMTVVELIRNSKMADTVNWRNEELPFCILVKSSKDQIDFKFVMNKLHLKEKKQIKFYKHLINTFNNPDPFRIPNPTAKLISYYSRPVFDNSYQYAAIQYDYPQRGFGIIVYHWTGALWKEMGPISRWSY